MVYNDREVACKSSAHPYDRRRHQGIGEERLAEIETDPIYLTRCLCCRLQRSWQTLRTTLEQLSLHNRTWAMRCGGHAPDSHYQLLSFRDDLARGQCHKFKFHRHVWCHPPVVLHHRPLRPPTNVRHFSYSFHDDAGRTLFKQSQYGNHAVAFLVTSMTINLGASRSSFCFAPCKDPVVTVMSRV